MAETSAIEWCDATWNPWWGCAEVSPGCSHCYAGTLARRYGYGDTWPAKGEAGYERAHEFRFFGDAHWEEPLKWARLMPAKLGRRPRVFCASMADVFEDRPELEEPRLRLFTLIAATPELDWLILTKRPEVARDWLHRLLWDHERRAYLEPNDYWSQLDSSTAPLPNVWMGTSIENARYTWRADVLREIPAAVRFLSCEPLLGSLYHSPRGLLPKLEHTDPASPYKRLDLTGIDWVIVGGESGGRKARPMHPDWAREIRDACTGGQHFAFPKEGAIKYAPYPLGDPARGPAFFFKQWGSWGHSAITSPLALYVAVDGSKTENPWQDPGFDAERENPGERWNSLARMSYLGVSPKSGGNRLDGHEWKEFPRSRVEAPEPERSIA